MRILGDVICPVGDCNLTLARVPFQGFHDLYWSGDQPVRCASASLEGRVLDVTAGGSKYKNVPALQMEGLLFGGVGQQPVVFGLHPLMTLAGSRFKPWPIQDPEGRGSKEGTCAMRRQ